MPNKKIPLPMLFLALALLSCPTPQLRADKDTAGQSAATVAEFFQSRGARITTGDDGKITKLFLGGKPELSVEDLQRIGQLGSLEELAINMPPASDSDWGFLHSLPKLRRLTIWHGHHFKSLEAFNGLPVEAITFGGCMGIRDLNRDDPEAQRNVSLTLRDLPNLKSLTLYHSPLTPDDRHLAHIVKSFPGLTELRLDFAAPRGQEIQITAAGLQSLGKLKLTRLALENAESLSAENFSGIAKIKTLRNLHFYPARGDAAEASITRYRKLAQTLSTALPGLEVTFQKPFVRK